MKGVIQRVKQASVVINEKTVGEIYAGILLFVGVEKTDDHSAADKLLHKVLNYRIFNDDQGKMNLGLQEVAGGLLIVSQFTLVANTQKGLRPSFSSASSPEQGEMIYNYLVQRARDQHPTVATGQFGADMKVSLLNDGPVTFVLSSENH